MSLVLDSFGEYGHLPCVERKVAAVDSGATEVQTGGQKSCQWTCGDTEDGPGPSPWVGLGRLLGGSGT